MNLMKLVEVVISKKKLVEVLEMECCKILLYTLSAFRLTNLLVSCLLYLCDVSRFRTNVCQTTTCVKNVVGDHGVI